MSPGLAIPAASPLGLIGDWSPGIGDPTPVGWLTVVAYLVAAWSCYRALLRAVPRPPRQAVRIALAGLSSLRPGRWGALGRAEPIARLGALWLCLAVLMLLLGVNKQLDLQTAVTEMGRILARSQGWYEERRWVQAAFVALVGLAGVAGLALVALLARGNLGEAWLALVGTTLVVVFVLVRGSSFHHVDALVGTEIGGVRANWVLELGGIACVVLGAWRRAEGKARPTS